MMPADEAHLTPEIHLAREQFMLIVKHMQKAVEDCRTKGWKHIRVSVRCDDGQRWFKRFSPKISPEAFKDIAHEIAKNVLEGAQPVQVLE